MDDLRERIAKEVERCGRLANEHARAFALNPVEEIDGIPEWRNDRSLACGYIMAEKVLKVLLDPPR